MMVLTTFHRDIATVTVTVSIVGPPLPNVLGTVTQVAVRGLDQANRPFKITMVALLHLRLA